MLIMAATSIDVLWRLNPHHWTQHWSTFLLRNSAKVALEHYTQAIPEGKYAAQARVLEMIFEGRKRERHIQAQAVRPTVN